MSLVTYYNSYPSRLLLLPFARAVPNEEKQGQPSSAQELRDLTSSYPTLKRNSLYRRHLW